MGRGIAAAVLFALAAVGRALRKPVTEAALAQAIESDACAPRY